MDLKHLQAICLPIGFSRAASQPLAHALTAHPEIVMSNRLNSLKNWWDKGKLLFADTFLSEILEMDRKAHENKISYTRKNKYYAIPGQWQGKVENMTLVGDCSPDTNTQVLIGKNCKAIEIFLNSVKLPLKFIFLVRNPYDMVSSDTLSVSWKKARDEILDIMVQRFTDECMRSESLLTSIKKMQKQHAEVSIWHLEDHIANPQQKLKELCDFLGVKSSESYLEACAKIFYKKPNQSRHLINWPDVNKAQIVKMIQKYEFLSRYSWES